MKPIIIYDSNFGNTQMLAEAIAKEINGKTYKVSEVDSNVVIGAKLIIVASPIIGWQPTVPMQKFLNEFKPGDLKGVKVAVFDTRVKLFIHGDAKMKMTQILRDAGANIAILPEHFYVHGQQGPLYKGEMERAVLWAKSIK